MYNIYNTYIYVYFIYIYVRYGSIDICRLCFFGRLRCEGCKKYRDIQYWCFFMFKYSVYRFGSMLHPGR